MNLQFATCEVKSAIRFLKKGYPDRNLNEDNLPKLIDALNKDIFRVTDPKFHTLALVTGNNYKDEHLPLLANIKSEIDSCPVTESEAADD